MIKVKVNKGKARITIKGERFETANEAVNIAVGMAEHFEKIDPAMGYAIRKTIIDALSGNLPELEKEEPKHGGYSVDTVIVDELYTTEGKQEAAE